VMHNLTVELLVLLLLVLLLITPKIGGRASLPRG